MADPITMAAVGLSIAGTATKTVGAMAGSQQDKMAAESRVKMAQIQSDQTEASSLDDLRRQIGNIKAIRASAGAQANSPTTQAIIDAERDVSGKNLDKKKASYRLDALQGKADSKLYQQKAYMQLGGGIFDIGNSLATADYG